MIRSETDWVKLTGMATPSPYQTKIFETITDMVNTYTSNGKPRGGLAVSAVAGAGKTTVAVASANLIPKNLNSIFLAFNKSIADELRHRLPPHVEARTLNSLGHRIVAPYVAQLGSNAGLSIDTGRTYKIMRSVLSWDQNSAFGKHVRFLVRMCKAGGIVAMNCPDGIGVNNMTATSAVLKAISINNFHFIEKGFFDDVVRYTNQVLRVSFSDSDLYSNGCIDFDDQKWLSVCKRPDGRTIAKPTYDVIFVDEVQDLNPVAQEMIRLVLKPNGIIVGIGDPNQSILGFAGSDPEAFNNFSNTFNCTKLPLSITYRCGKSLVKYAKELVPEIEAHEMAKDGAVEVLSSWDVSLFQKGDMILCRNNAPMVSLAFKMIAADIPVVVKGKAIGDKLIDVINDIAGESVWKPNPAKHGKNKKVFTLGNIDISAVLYKLSIWKTHTTQKLMDNNATESQISAISDISDSIEAFCNTMNTTDLASDMVTRISNLYSDNIASNVVTCSTIHKAKGLEADRVFLYKPNLLYPQYVPKDGWLYQQEINLDYIARTRGKTLYAILEEENDQCKQ